MTIESVSQSDPSDQHPGEILTIIVGGKAYRYWITPLTRKCWLFTALRTGKTIQFRSAESMWNFLYQLIGFLDRAAMEKLADGLREEAHDAMIDHYNPPGLGL